MNGDPSSTQILTRYYGAKSETISQLMNLGTALTRKALVAQPLWFIETPMEEVGVHAAPPSDNPNGTMGLN
jgi:hypothetical protein